MGALNNLCCDPKISLFLFHRTPPPSFLFSHTPLLRNELLFGQRTDPILANRHHHHHHRQPPPSPASSASSGYVPPLFFSPPPPSFFFPLLSSRRYLYTSLFSLFSLFHVHAGAIHSFYFRRSSSTNLYPQITTDPPRILHPPVTSLLGGSIRQTPRTLCKKIDHSTLDSVDGRKKKPTTRTEGRKKKNPLFPSSRGRKKRRTRKGKANIRVHRRRTIDETWPIAVLFHRRFLLHTSFFVRKLLINTVRDAS